MEGGQALRRDENGQIKAAPPVGATRRSPYSDTCARQSKLSHLHRCLGDSKGTVRRVGRRNRFFSWVFDARTELREKQRSLLTSRGNESVTLRRSSKETLFNLGEAATK